MTFATAFLAAALVVPSMPQPEYDDGEVITNCVVAYSMLTHDGRRMISRKNGGKTVYELVPTNRLPASLPPVRPWTIYGIKSAHSDLGLHRSNYIQRKGTVLRMDKARELIAADRRPDSDPAAFRWVVEGWWSFLNYPADRGEPAARPFVDELRRRGRFDVGGNWCGSTTHVMGYTVHREAEDGISPINVRYEECGLEPGRKYEYRLRPVFRNGHRGELGTPFYGLTRAKDEETQPRQRKKVGID